ncbi:MAG: hypothetical protein OSJ23_10775 [Mucispirillum schaedleri]|nr:hypothetical protein [Mucispirillum schaedleri]
MPPKPIVNKQDILNAAIQLVRENGMESINARSLAKIINCSTKPLFRIYKNMEELKKDILEELNNYYNNFMNSRMKDKNKLLNQGIAYIEFAQKEKSIFSTLFMSKAIKGFTIQDIVLTDKNNFLVQNVKDITGLSEDKAYKLIINIWFYSHGIATQIVSNGIDISLDVIVELMSEAYHQFSTNIPITERGR